MSGTISFGTCPTPGPTTISAGTPSDKCGDPASKLPCCINATQSLKSYTLYTDGTTNTAKVATSACTKDLVIPSFQLLEWTKFSTTDKPACVTTASIITKGTWLGLIDNNWSTPGNWAGNVVPGSTDTALFDGTCSAIGSSNCSTVNIDANVTVANITIDTAATLTSLVSGASTISVSSTWTQQSTSATTVFDGTLASSISIANLVLTKGTFKASTSGANAFSGTVGISTGATYNNQSGSTTITGLLTMSGGTYTSSGTDTFNGGVTLTSGTVTTGTLSSMGIVSIAAGTWNLSSGTSTFNSDNSTTQGVTVSGGTILPAANATVNFNSKLTSGSLVLSGGSFGASTPVTGTTVNIGSSAAGLFTMTSASSNYYSGGNDNFNGGVTITNAGTITTGTLVANGNVSIAGGTWNLSSTTSTFNSTSSSTTNFSMSGGTIKPAGTTSFSSTKNPSMAITGGTIGATTTSGTINIAGNVTMTPSSTNIFFHDGTASLTITGSLTMNDVIASSNTVIFGDSVATGTITINAGVIISSNGGSVAGNPLFTQGSATLAFSSYSQTTNATGAGSTFTGGNANMTVAGNFTYSCTISTTGTDLSIFTGPSGASSPILELDGGTISISTASSSTNRCANEATRFNLASSNLYLHGGTQTLGGTNAPGGANSGVGSMSIKTLMVDFNAASKTKTFSSAITVSGTGTGLTLTNNQTGSAIAFSSTLTVTNDSAINLTAGALTSSGTLTTSGNLTISPAGGTLAINGTYNVAKNFTSTDTGANITGTGTLTMSGSTSPAYITMGTGTFGAKVAINKTSSTNIVGLNSTTAPFSNTIVINSGNLQLNPSAGTCSGTTVCNVSTTSSLTIGASSSNGNFGTLTCGVGTYTVGTLSISGGQIFCSQYGGNWTGLAHDGKWSTPGNWKSGVVPTTSQLAYFSGSNCSGTDCTVSVDTSQNPAAVYMASDYNCANCIITQNAALTLSTLTGFEQYAGTFNTNNQNLTIGGSFVVSSGATFTPGSGTFKLSGAYTSSNPTDTWDFTNVPGTFSGPVFLTTNNGGNPMTITIVGTLNVSGAITIGEGSSSTTTYSGGTISATGNVTIAQSATYTYGVKGTTLIDIAGTGAQTVSAASTTASRNYIPAFKISNATGPVTFTSGNTFNFYDVFTHSGAAPLTTTGATFNFAAASAKTYTFQSSDSFPTVIYAPSGTGAITTSGTFTVTGTFNIAPTGSSCTMTSGTIIVTGSGNSASGDFQNTSASGIGCSGTTNVKLNAASGTQYIKNTNGVLMPALEIATNQPVTFSSGNTFQLSNAYNVSATTPSLTTTGSTLTFAQTAASTVTVGSTVTYNNVNFSPTNTVTLNDDLNVQGSLSLGSSSGCRLNKGTGNGWINFSGLSLTISGNCNSAGTGLLKIIGPYTGTSQSIATTTGNQIPNTEVSSSQTLNFSGTGLTYNFVAALTISGNPTLSFGTNTLSFDTATASTITPNAAIFGNVTFNNSQTTTLSGTLSMTGRLTFSSTTTLNSGTISSTGTSVVYGVSPTGSTALTLAATSGNITLDNTALSTSGHKLTGAFTLNAAGKTATFSSATAYGIGGSTASATPVNVTAGTLIFSGLAKTTGTLTVASASGAVQGAAAKTVTLGNLVLNSATYTKNTGTLAITAGSAPCNGTLTTGSLCGGTIAP